MGLLTGSANSAGNEIRNRSSTTRLNSPVMKVGADPTAIALVALVTTLGSADFGCRLVQAGLPARDATRNQTPPLAPPADSEIGWQNQHIGPVSHNQLIVKERFGHKTHIRALTLTIGKIVFNGPPPDFFRNAGLPRPSPPGLATRPASLPYSRSPLSPLPSLNSCTIELD